MSFACSENKGPWFNFIPHLIYVCRAGSTQPGIFVFEMSSLSALLYSEKVYWSITARHWNQLPPILIALWDVAKKTLHPSQNIVPSPFCGHGLRPCARTHPLPSPAQSSMASLSPAQKASVTNRCCSTIVFPPFLFPTLPPQRHFFQPWHKMVKWCSTAEFNFTVQLGPWLHCQIQINVHWMNMDQGNSGWQPAVIGAIDSCVEFYALSTSAHCWWNWLIKWIHCYNYL